MTTPGAATVGVIDDASTPSPPNVAVTPPGRMHFWGRVLGWVGLGGQQRRQETEAESSPVATPPAKQQQEQQGEVKATSALFIRRQPHPGRRWERNREEDRYWWRFLVV